VLDSDEAYRLSPDALGAAIDADLAAGRRPMMVIATVGTTNTGTVDDVPSIADLCSRHGLWLHVDGANGGPAALRERGRNVMPGLERADIACLFVRETGALRHTFAGRQANDADHYRVVAQLTADGYGAASSTALNGRTALRMCTINPRTTTQDIDGTIGRLADYLAIP
jgi:glutamate/tyrosine decarboxylase-like PLP-dependent enzyme